jgi:hypothetical protein
MDSWTPLDEMKRKKSKENQIKKSKRFGGGTPKMKMGEKQEKIKKKEEEEEERRCSIQ